MKEEDLPIFKHYATASYFILHEYEKGVKTLLY